MKHLTRILVLAALVFTAVLLWPAKIRPSAQPSSPAHAAFSGPAPEPLRPHPQSQPLADRLNASSGDPAEDVIILHRLLVLYQRALHNRQGTPIGDDIDLARALTGRNPMRQAFIPAGHPALASDGHLIDRWGTPYFLHTRGNGAFEVRSAGPDRKLFTADDLVANPAPPGR